MFMRESLFAFFFLSSNLYPEIEHVKGNIHIVYHIATMHNWEEIAETQLSKLEQSGLLEYAQALHITVVGPDIDEVRNLFQNAAFQDKVDISYAGSDVKQCEFPGIEMVKHIADLDADAKILYMHSRGVSHWLGKFEKNVGAWRDYLEYFTIEQWRQCVDVLDIVDACGAEWRDNPFRHFSGNFWWARASYIKTLQMPERPYTFEKRYDCESFIGTGNNMMIREFHNSGIDSLYLEPYPPEKYRYH